MACACDKSCHGAPAPAYAPLKDCDPREEVKLVVGFFKRDVPLVQLVQKMCDGSTAPLRPSELLANIFSFSSELLDLKATAQSNQIVTFHLQPQYAGLGAGMSHLTKIPIYCNIARRQVSLPGTLENPLVPGTLPVNFPLLDGDFFIPEGLGQYTLQYNPFLNNSFTFAPDMDPASLDSHGINYLLALLKNCSIPAGTPIFKGVV